MHLAKPHNILSAKIALLDSTAEGVLQELVTDDYGRQILVWIDIVVVPRIRRNLFSVRTAAKRGIAAIFDYENFRGSTAATGRGRRPLLVRVGLERGRM